MSEENHLKEEVKDEASKVVNKHPRNKLKLNRNLIIAILILLALPLTVGLALVQQEIRGRAAGQTIARVEVSPGVVSAMEKGPNIGLSALAYDFSGNPINHSAVTYEWSMSSTNSVGTLTKTSGVITEFKPLKYGCGQIVVIARPNTNALGEIKNKLSLISKVHAQTAYVAKAVSVSVGSPNGMPNCGSTNAKHPLKITTPNVTLDAEDFSLRLNGKTYYAENANITATSDSGSEITTLRSSWTESDGTPMILNIYFKRSLNDRSKFEIIEFATNDGKNPPQTTIYFKGDRSWGNFGNYGYSAFWQSINLTEPLTNANLVLNNVTMFPFALYKAPLSPTPLPVKTTTINAFQDAFVRSDKATTNFGYGIRLRGDGNPKVISYLKFDISPVIGKKIVSAKLRLKVSTDSGSGSSDSYNLRSIGVNSWNEGSVKYNNRPSLGTILKKFTGKGDGQTIDIDVKSLIGNTAKFSWAIATEGTNELILHSREAGTGKPQLIIEYQ